MSRPHYGGDTDRSNNAPGSVQRARESVQANMSRDGRAAQPPRMRPELDELEYSSNLPRPNRPPQSQPRYLRHKVPSSSDGRGGQVISRPTQLPQWPLAASNTSSPSYAGPNVSQRPSGGMQQAPQRPPRPSQSRIPSMLDGSRPQQPTPVFTSRAQNAEGAHHGESDVYDTRSPQEEPQRQTASSMGTLPEFAMPTATNGTAPLRKSTTLGPPPSSRRGASSFYSSTSYVSPIPEESPRSKSHGSFASSAAMPESWPADSPHAGSPQYGDAFYEESSTERSRESIYDEYGDESQLVRSASLGKKGKPSLVTTKAPSGASTTDKRPPVTPLPLDSDGTGYASAVTNSSETMPAPKNGMQSYQSSNEKGVPSSDAIRKAIARASAAEPVDSSPGIDEPLQTGHRPNLKRPPRLDIDAVRDAEARGSLTSLPDLIRRATRLAAMIEKGRRPTSRLDTLETYLDEKGADGIYGDGRHRSGLSDMLAAFPPPVHTPRNNTNSRSSWLRVSTWPTGPGQDRRNHSRSASDGGPTKKPSRRCCGLPLWAFICLTIFLLCLIVAAVVVPLEFFVFKNLGQKKDDANSLSKCQESLACLNGGTSVLVQGNCSCICTNGFTGSTCGEAGSTGCTTTNLVSADGSSTIKNVTLGRAIPRLIAEANANYSIPLSGTSILARFNSAGLSCIAQNSLVTFDGRSTRAGKATDEVEDVGKKEANLILNAEQFSSLPRITITPPTTTTTVTLVDGNFGQIPATSAATSANSGSSSIETPSEAISTPMPSSSGEISSRTTTTSGPNPPNSTLTVTEEILDFCRVAMLYILQEKGADEAVATQTKLQQLFSSITKSKSSKENVLPEDKAENVDLGGGKSINLIKLSVDIGAGAIGDKN